MRQTQPGAKKGAQKSQQNHTETLSVIKYTNIQMYFCFSWYWPRLSTLIQHLLSSKTASIRFYMTSQVVSNYYMIKLSQGNFLSSRRPQLQSVVCFSTVVPAIQSLPLKHNSDFLHLFYKVKVKVSPPEKSEELCVNTRVSTAGGKFKVNSLGNNFTIFLFFVSK